MSTQKLYRSCPGCYESIYGHPPPGATRHPKHGCYLGMGCRECQGRGFKRDRAAEFVESMTVEDFYAAFIREEEQL